MCCLICTYHKKNEVPLGVKRIKPILHYALGLHFGKVCEQKHEQKHEKMQQVCVFTQHIV